MKDSKKVKILCITGVLLLSIFTLSNCDNLIEEEIRRRPDCYLHLHGLPDSVWCDTDCDGTTDILMPCKDCYDFECDYDDDC